MNDSHESFFNSLDETYITNNKLLEKKLAAAKTKLKAVEDENEKLKQLVLYYQEGADKGETMWRYVDGIRHNDFRPAYKKNASVDAIIKIIHEDKTTDLNYIAEKLKVSYTTVYRRLKAAKYFPIDKEYISEYYSIFIDED